MSRPNQNFAEWTVSPLRYVRVPSTLVLVLSWHNRLYEGDAVSPTFSRIRSGSEELFVLL